MNRGLILIFMMIFSFTLGAQSSLIEIESSAGGLVLSKLTNAERNAIANPQSGLIVVNLESGCLNYYFSMKWYEVCGDSSLTCALNADCPPGQMCNNGKCVDVIGGIPCETEEQCPAGQMCVGGFCQNP